MAIPTTAQKRFFAAGAIKSAEIWGTAETITQALGGMLIESDGGLVRSQAYHPANEADTPFVKEGDLGDIDPVDFAPGFFMRYDPGIIGVLIAQLFGTCGEPTAKGGDAYTQTIQWDNENDGEFCTFAIERRDKIFEVPSAKPYSFDLSVADGFLKGSIGLRGNSVVEGVVNTDLDSITYKDRDNRIRFSQGMFDMNDQGEGDALAETDLIISDFSVHYERPIDGLHCAGGAGIVEPAQNGQPIITATLTFPRMSAINAAYFADFIAETEKKLRIEFTGIQMDPSAQHYNLRMFFPRMRIINIEYTFDEIVPATITLQAEEAAAAPSGMGLAIPYLMLANKRSSKYIS